jgi:diaminopimelate epimerase
MRWTQACGAGFCATTALLADGEVVWSWRRDRGVYFAGGIPQTTVTINAAHRGEHEGNRNTIARGKPV